MKADDLLDIIGEADDRYIDSAKKAKQKASPGWEKWLASAAAIFVAILFLPSLFSLFFGPRSGAGSSGDLSYMVYRGPVLPMSVQGDADGITAQRNVNFDFSAHHRESLITDTYTLTNESGEDKTMTLLYPYSGGLNDPLPEITVEGAAVETAYHPGPYRFGYQGAYGSKNPDAGSIMVKDPEQFEDYEALLADGSYVEAALDELPPYDQTVYVYRLHDYICGDAPEPAIGLEFDIDPQKTQVLFYGMDCATYDPETGIRGCYKRSIDTRAWEEPPDDCYVVVLGEDLENYTVQGFKYWLSTKTPDVTCTVTRYETTMAGLLSDLGAFSPDWVEAEKLEKLPSLIAELLQTYGPLSEQPTERLADGNLDSIFTDVYNVQRVNYLSFSVTIPAGQTITVEAAQIKQASVDATGRGKDRNGYDLATRLGSDLIFTEQTASLSGYENIKIVDQNFGFKPWRGVTEVTLDLEQPHYWLVVREN